jgi:hypothetical protein
MMRKEAMAAKINYDDDIYYLDTLVSAIQTGLSLDIDPEFFRDKIVEDIFFVDVSLKRIFDSLEENSFLIRRAEYLRSLLRVARIFVDFLHRLLAKEIAFAEHLEPYFLKLRGAVADHERTAERIDDMLQVAEPSEGDEDFVSQDEFRFLLQEDDSDEDEQ